MKLSTDSFRKIKQPIASSKELYLDQHFFWQSFISQMISKTEWNNDLFRKAAKNFLLEKSRWNRFFNES